MSDFLSDIDIARFASSSMFFFNETQGISYWKNKLFSIIKNRVVLEEAIQTHAIINYGRLYHTLTRLKDRNHENNEWSLWELLCLSGEVSAVRYTIDYKLVDALTENKKGQSALHVTALSGNAPAMEVVASIPGLNLTASTHLGNNVMHFAAWSGSVAAMQMAANIPGLKLTATNNARANALHLAVGGGYTSATKEACKIKNLDLTAATSAGHNAMHLAAWIGNVAVIEMIAKIPKLHLTAVTLQGRNAMHFAVLSKKTEAIIFLRRLDLSLGLGFDLNVEDRNGHRPYWYADNCSDTLLRDTLRLALTKPVQALNLDEWPVQNNTKNKLFKSRMTCTLL